MKTKETKYAVAVIEKKLIPTISEQVLDLCITDGQSLSNAAEILSQANKYLDAVIEDREKITKPLNEALKAARAKYKPIESKLEDIVDTLRDKMSTYQTEEKAKLEAEKTKVAEDLASGKIKKIETAVRKMGQIGEVDRSVTTENGIVKFKTVKKFEVTDIRLLPLDCIMPDESAIRDKMKANVEVPGVRYFEEQVPVNYR